MRLLPVLTGLVVFATSAIFPIQADNLQFFRIGTGGVAGTYYPIGGIIASAVSNPPGSRPCNQGGSCGPPGLVVIAQSANGSVANVRGMQLGQLESGFVQSDIAYWAYTGTGTFSGERPFRKLRAIANLYPESIHLVTRSNSGIRSVRDLVGRRVSLDEPGSGTLIDAELVLDAFGISRNDIVAEHVKPDLAVRRIRENRLDAFFIVAGYPARAVAELAQDTAINLVPIDGPEADELVARHQFFSRADIPAGVYSGVPRVETVSVGAQWLVASNMEEEMIYQITKTLWNQNSRKLLDSGHAKGKYITLDTAMEGIAVPLHPGARRFYSEVGILSE
jgi:TRAP transporter TAXI family solute receptor